MSGFIYNLVSCDVLVGCLSYCQQSCILATSTSKWSVTYTLPAEYFCFIETYVQFIRTSLRKLA